MFAISCKTATVNVVRSRRSVRQPTSLACGRVMKNSRSVIVYAEPNSTETTSDLQAAIQDANQTCIDGTAEDCAVAWDTVEEISAARKDKKLQEEMAKKNEDPLEEFCKDTPDADECRVYED